MGVNRGGHWNTTTRAPRARATSAVASHAARTSSVGRNDPYRSRSSGGMGRRRRRYVGLEASWVINCQAFTLNSNSGGASARHRVAVCTCGGW